MIHVISSSIVDTVFRLNVVEIPRDPANIALDQYHPDHLAYCHVSVTGLKSAHWTADNHVSRGSTAVYLQT